MGRRFLKWKQKQNERLLSLVRLQRAELHQADAITDKEYGELVQESHLRVVLETHDDLRSELSALQQENGRLRTLVEAWDECNKAVNATDTDAAAWERIKRAVEAVRAAKEALQPPTEKTLAPDPAILVSSAASEA